MASLRRYSLTECRCCCCSWLAGHWSRFAGPGGVGDHHLGWLNPTLYADASRGAFNDITEGSNTDGRNGVVCAADALPVGFDAAPGWDGAGVKA